jgi:magnesium chelatase family protein
VSGPIVDRIDLFVPLAPLSFAELTSGSGESSATVLDRVTAARAWTRAGAGDEEGISPNAALSAKAIRRRSPLTTEAERLLQHALERLALSARSHDRVLRVAKTIADLGQSRTIAGQHVAEALHYRDGGR